MGHYVLQDSGRIIKVWDDLPTQEEVQEILEADFHEELEEIDGELHIDMVPTCNGDHSVEISVTSEDRDHCRSLSMPLNYVD